MITATRGQDFDCNNEKLAKDLIKAGYAEPVAGKPKSGDGAKAPTAPQNPPAAKKDEESEAPATSPVNKFGAKKGK
jgi:hypothetical protein